MRTREIEALCKALATDGPPKHLRTLSRIIELRMGEGLGFIRIAQRLNQEGHTGRLGKPFSFVTVRRQIQSMDLGTLSPNTCMCVLQQGEEVPELGQTWTGRFREWTLTGTVEEIVWHKLVKSKRVKMDRPKILIRPHAWPDSELLDPV